MTAKNLLALGLIFLFGCSNAQNKQEATKPQPQPAQVQMRLTNDTLTQIAAMQRSSHLQNVRYDLTLNIGQDKQAFDGENKITFTTDDTDRDLRVDFKTGKILSLKVNGQEILNYRSSFQAFFIPASRLKLGENEVLIKYEHDYEKTGVGLHRFEDPKDHLVYLYSHFEPNDASLMLPCFDQPDIKAIFTLTVQAPKNWVVVSTTNEVSKKSSDFGHQEWKFSPSPRMSTYLFSLAAGPFKIWTDKYKKIPLRLMARKSLATYVTPKDWFITTKQGLAFYEKYFDYPYPFKKYDQVIVPEFNIGAMENIGNVNFSERFVSRGKKTNLEKERLAAIILHEMAHMWFGDLVTMKWWDDLWLNESFATFMSAKALTSATSFKNGWLGFFAGEKVWAYQTDQFSTTHPIKGQVASADEASNNFDGITYGKGASVLKQLDFLLGEENFRAGLRDYFRKYEYKNATLDDFIGALSQRTSQDLEKWKGSWLMTSRPDQVSAKFICNGNKLSELQVSIHSTTPQQEKTHAFQVALARMKNNRIEVYHHYDLRTAGDQVLKGDNLDCPEMVFPNFNDYGYFTTSLDPVTLENVEKNLSRVQDPLLRLMFWDSLWQMVRDQNIRLQDYAAIAEKNLLPEPEFLILSRNLRTLTGGGYSATSSVSYYWPTTTIEQKNLRTQFLNRMQSLYLKQIKEAAPGSDLQQLWMDNLINATSSKMDTNILADWLENKINFKGLATDQDRRWNAILRLCHFDHPKAVELLRGELKKDSSDRAKTAALACEASRPQLEVKKKWWGAITETPPKYSFKELSAVMGKLFEQEQREQFSQEFSSSYFKYLSEQLATQKDQFQAVFTTNLAPGSCSAQTRQPLQEFVDNHPGFAPVVIKNLKEEIDLDERCERIRTKALSL